MTRRTRRGSVGVGSCGSDTTPTIAPAWSRLLPSMAISPIQDNVQILWQLNHRIHVISHMFCNTALSVIVRYDRLCMGVRWSQNPAVAAVGGPTQPWPGLLVGPRLPERPSPSFA